MTLKIYIEDSLRIKNFSLIAERATNKIDFGVINRHSNIVNVLERIEATPTSVGSPDWKRFDHVKTP